MLWQDIFTDAAHNLLRKKLRTFLTTAGVAIGIFTVFLTLALAVGIKNFLTYQMRTYGNTKVLQVHLKGGFSPERMLHSRMGGLGQTPKPLKDESTRFEMKMLDEEKLQQIRSLEGVKSVGPMVFAILNSIRLYQSEERFDVVQLPFIAGESLELVAGREFSSAAAAEVILSYSYVPAFGYRTPEELLGKEVVVSVARVPPAQFFLARMLKEKLKNFRVKIVGFVGEGLLSTAAYFPENFAIEMGRFSFGIDNLFTPQNYGFIARVVVNDEKHVLQVQSRIEELGFRASSVLEQLEAINKLFLTIEGVLSLFGVIAIVVACLGIINTLIMSIHERRREIGVMKAVGATQGEITLLYAVEAATIGLCGSISGIAIGMAVGGIGNVVAAHLYPGYWRAHMLFWLGDFTVLAALMLFGCIVGLLAGIYPARKAAKLDPIRALKYE
jgi:putative ABC transport system permease protein